MPLHLVPVIFAVCHETFLCDDDEDEDVDWIGLDWILLDWIGLDDIFHKVGLTTPVPKHGGR